MGAQEMKELAGELCGERIGDAIRNYKGQSCRSQAPEQLFHHQDRRNFEYHWKQRDTLCKGLEKVPVEGLSSIL